MFEDGPFTQRIDRGRMTHYVYIATSTNLLDWAGQTHGRAAVKVGESWNPADREIWLSGRPSRGVTYVRPCAGFEDWKVIAEKGVATRDDGLEIEAIFKTAFDPAYFPRSGAGEGDIVLLPEPPLSANQIAALHPAIRDLYMAARSRMHVPDRAEDGLYAIHGDYVSDEDRELQRDMDLYGSDRGHDRSENQDRSARESEEGWYYED